MTQWIKSCGTSSCIEVQFSADGLDVLIRNNREPIYMVMATGEELRNFVEAAKAGLFDRPVGGAE